MTFKILFIINHFYPEIGAVRTEFEISKILSWKNEVLVITTFPRRYRLPTGYIYKKSWFSLAYVENVERIKILRIVSFLSRTDNIKQRVPELLTGIISLFIGTVFLAPFYNIIVVAGDIEIAIALTGILSAKIIWKKPIVAIVHDIHPDVLIKSGIIKGGLLLKISQLLIRIFSKYIDLVIVHSDLNKIVLSKRYNIPLEKVKVLNLWANINEIKPADIAEKQIIKKKYGFNPNKVLVTFAGIMNPPQGLDVVIQAASIIKENFKDKDIIILLVGDGSEKIHLKKLANKLGVNDIVRFLPLQPRDKYINLIRMSDICLVTLRPGYWQPVVPSKLIEMMAAGCPVVLSMPPRSDAVRIVARNKAGIYAGEGDPEKLAKAIIKLVENEHLRRRMGINARMAVERHYSLNQVAKNLENIINKIAAK